MKSEELAYLEEEKERNGKSREQAYKEVEMLKNSQVHFKQLERQIKSLTYQLKKKDKLIEVLQKNSFKLITEPKHKQKQEQEKDNSCIRHLTRILDGMEINKKYSKSGLAKELIIPYKLIDGYLKFLKRTSLIKLDHINGYYIRK